MYFQSACFAIDSASVTASHSPSHDDVSTQAVLSLSTQSFPSLFLNLALTKHLAEHQTDLALLLFSGSVLVEVLQWPPADALLCVCVLVLDILNLRPRRRRRGRYSGRRRHRKSWISGRTCSLSEKQAQKSTLRRMRLRYPRAPVDFVPLRIYRPPVCPQSICQQPGSFGCVLTGPTR